MDSDQANFAPFHPISDKTGLNAGDIADIVNHHIRELLNQHGETATTFSSNTPLMALGLSSLELLVLRDQLSSAFEENLHATFFFQYTTAEAIANYFIESILHRHYSWLYDVEYRALSAPQTEPLSADSLWVIFADKSQRFSSALLKELQAQGQQVITLTAGEQFEKKDQWNFVVRSDEQADINKVFGFLSHKNIEGIVYLWGLEDHAPTPINLSYLKKQHRFSCEGVLLLVKALRGHLAQKNPRLWIISEYTPESGGALSLETGPLAWLSGAIMTEHPELRCQRCVLDKSAPLKENVERCLIFFKSPSNEEQITWLNGIPCSRRLIRLKLPQAKKPVTLDPNATYLIVGGCGGLGSLGLYVAQWHIEHGAKKLLLLDPIDILKEATEFIQGLRVHGVQIDVIVGDVTHKESLAKILRAYHKSDAPIRGITHVLGLMDDDKLINLDWNRFENIMQYKVQTSWILHELSQELNLKLDHFILFSAIGSIMGPLWRSSRSAANGFVSALAHYRRSQGLPALAIDWGPWEATTLATEPLFDVNIPEGLKILNVKEGMQLLSELYHSPLPEVAALDVDWSKLLKRYTGDRPLFYDILSELGLRRSEIFLQLHNQKENQQQKISEHYVEQHLRRILFKPAYQIIDAKMTLKEIGVDNLRLDEFKQNIQYDLGPDITISQALIHENMTVEDLAKGLLAYIKTFESNISSQAIKPSNEPIAIIGMACRFPGAKNYHELWTNLVNRVDSIAEIPSTRWDWRAIYGDPKSETGKTNIKWGGFIDDIDKFDPLFFNISPKEAAYMDPQHRIFLQTAWHAMEDAGYSSKMLAGKKVGVYAGVSKNDYAELMRENHAEILPYISTGTVHSILTNRVSYTLDLHGPSESVDTACSSALVALHSAIRDIRSGECHLAFVGGVNALLSPTMHISHARSGFLSEDGHCKTFDASANGYVRGEGVGVLLLKPLKDALNDGDVIHAVIQSAAVNHGGKSSGLTAPNITAQAEVVQQALKEADADPRTITYIEVHGTGTPLGDPIEIEGLKKAFASAANQVSEEKYCLLGAIKTNVGHCESAAGMTGIIKMVLAMKYHAIPANLNFKSLNPKIELEGSPFLLANSYQEWNPVDRENNPLPRRGGVSSFGMGGANTHVIMEEAPVQQPKNNLPTEKLLFPLSAKKGRLLPYVKAFYDYLSQNVSIDLRSLAYTLQTGRDPFEERVIFRADSLEALRGLVNKFLQNEKDPNIFSNLFKEDQVEVDALGKIARSWIQREIIDWDARWKQKPIRLSGIPGYPFLPLRCWFGDGKEQAPVRVVSKQTSSELLEGAQLSMGLSTNRFFLKDHIVAGRSIMPGVMYLEIARDATEKMQSGKTVSAIKNVNWVSSFEAQGEIMHVTIVLEGEGLSHFKILEGNTLKCSGDFVYEKSTIKPERQDISKIIELCNHKKEQSEIYEKMKLIGLQQGPSLRVIREFYSGPRNALAKINLNPSENLSEFVLHPALMDGVYQTVVAHHFSEHADGMQQYLPYALESVEWFGPLEKEVYAFVEELPESKKGFLKYRMKMLTLAGEVIVQFDGFARRPLKQDIEKPIQEIPAYKSIPMKDFYYVDSWAVQKAMENRKQSVHLLLFSSGEALKQALSKALPQTKIITIGAGTHFEKHSETHYVLNPASLSDYQELMNELKENHIIINDIVYTWDMFDLSPILYLTQSLMQSHVYQDLLLLYLYSQSSELSHAQYAMAAGFARTLIYENQRMGLRSVEADAATAEDWAKITAAELKEQGGCPLLEVSYAQGTRKIRSVIPAAEIENFIPKENLLKKGGTYLITGGAGGLGMVFSRYLADHYQATLILVGRSKLNPAIQKNIDTLQATAASVYYLSADVNQIKDLKTAFSSLPKSVQDNINGVIHAAGLKQDSFILKKEIHSFNQVIDTKVKGALNLDTLTANLKLDFMVVFSSIAAFIPNQGQADYAAANSFLDRFSRIRNQLVREKKRSGLTLAINWPLWASGGMQVTAEQEKHLKMVFGMDPLATEMGIQVFEHLLNVVHEVQNPQDQVIVISGDKTKIMRAFEGSERTQPLVEPEKVAPVMPRKEVKVQAPETTQEDATKFLTETIAKVLNIPAGELDPDTDFEHYGINSIVITEINTLLEQRFKGLSKTLFFEYPNLRELIGYITSQPYSASQQSVQETAVEQKKAAKIQSHETPQEDAAKFLTETIAKVLNIPAGELDPDTDFEHYGINSIVITEINTLLEQRFKGLPKTLFFEYPNLRELIGYITSQPYSVSKQSVQEVPVTSKKEVKIHYPLIDKSEKRAEFSTSVKIFKSDQLYVKGFSIKGKPAVPGACFLEMARQGASSLFPDRVFISVFNNYWPVPLGIEKTEIEARTKFIPFADIINFEISSQDQSGQEIIHATGSLATQHRFSKPMPMDIAAKITTASSSIKSEKFYETIHQNADLRLAGAFRPVQELHIFENEAIARLVLSEEIALANDPFMIQPIMFTGLEQTLLVYTALTHAKFHPQGMRLMPVSIEAVDLYAPFPAKAYLHISAKKTPSANNKIQKFDATLYDDEGAIVAFVSGNTMHISPLEASSEAEEMISDNDIAIIGMSGRFPDADDIEEYWNNLLGGKDSISKHPMHQDLYHSELADQEEGLLACKYGGSIKSVDTFDPEFFGIAPVEGALIDPQERLFLQVAWEALQDAGWDPKKMSPEARKLGVFVGAIWQDYQLIALEETLKGHPVVASSLLYSIANRVSYTFNFTGPSLSVDTACSSSLTALYLACRLIAIGDIQSAIVGGVNLNLHPMKYAFLNNYSFLSKEGKCRSYGEGGSGYVPGEGIGALVIKSLKEAIKDGDPIWGVIKGVATNHGGKTRGFTVPTPALQSEVILKTIEQAKINPRDISYVEGHGTGTALGDPVEIRGLDLAYSKFTSDKQYCAIGSVKSNIGHLEAAAGVASVIKVLLQMNYGILVPSLHSEMLNKNIDFPNTPFYVQQKVAPWKSEKPYLAAVSSFGAGGSYAHVILEKYGKSREIRKPEKSVSANKYWIEQKNVTAKIRSSPLLGERSSVTENKFIFLGQLDLSALPYLKDHQVYKEIIYPAAAYIEMLLSAGTVALGTPKIHLEEVNFEAVLKLTTDKATKIKIELALKDPDHADMTIYAQNDFGDWMMHARGLAKVGNSASENIDFKILKADCKNELSKPGFYDYVHACGLNLHEKFQTLNTIWLGEHSAFGEIVLPTTAQGYTAQPALLDGCLQLLYALFRKEKKSALYLPVAMDSIDLYRPLGEHVFAYLHSDNITDTNCSANLKIWSPTGQLLAVVNGARFRKVTEESLSQVLSHQDVFSNIYYEWDWQEYHSKNPVSLAQLGDWLILGEGAASDQLVSVLERKGATCHRIFLADLPASKEEFIKLLQSKPFKGIVHAAGAGQVQDLNSASVSYGQTFGVKNVLHLAQTLIQENMNIPVILITQNIAKNNMPYNTLNGLIKTILLERPELLLKQIDLVETWDPELLLNLIFENNEESLYRLEGKQCYVPRLTKIKNLFENQRESASIGNKIRSDATYLITGGLGGLGLTLAKWLVKQGAGKLVLTGRGALKEESKIKELEMGKTEIIYQQLDVSNELAVKNLLGHLEKSEKPLKGIFHLAGILDDAAFTEQNWSRFEKVFAAKVYGSLYLHQYSKDLDLFVMFSSIASMLGNPGQSNYAAANAFMDALCEYRHEHGLPGLSISWGPWAEVGMAKDLVAQHTKSGLLGLTPDEGMRALEQVLSSDRSSILIAKMDWESYTSKMMNVPSYLASFAKEKGEAENVSVQFKTLSDSERISMIQTHVIESLRSILGLSPLKEIDVKYDFFDMGLDSLMSLELKNRIQKLIGPSPVLPGTAIFDYSSVEKISHYVNALLSEVKQSELKEVKLNKPKEILKYLKPLEITELPDNIVLFPPKKILITGASGFLGAFLLKSLAEKFKEAIFYCLVRAKDDAEAKKRVIDNLQRYKINDNAFVDRIMAYASDLIHPNFGLENSIYTKLAAEVDMVINSAAYLNWAYNYQALAPHNVESTREIIKFAAVQKLKDIHHISSIAVFPREFGKTAEIDEDMPLLHDGDLSNNGLSNGYFQSKWAAEVLVSDARKKGIKINVYRPVSLVGDSQNGIPGLDEFSFLMTQACRRLRIAPENDMLLDILPVDFAAEVIAVIISKGHPKNQNFNIVNKNPVPIRKLFMGLQDAGEPVQIVPRETWDLAAQEVASEPAEHPLKAIFNVIPAYLSLADPNYSAKNTLAIMGDKSELIFVDEHKLVRTFIQGLLDYEKKNN